MEMLDEMSLNSRLNVSATRLRGTDSAKVIQVIETQALQGAGTTDDPYCTAIQYWSLDGKFLAERH